MAAEYRTYEVRLSLRCATEGCGATGRYTGATRKAAEAAARFAGWSMPRRLFAYCDEHKGEPPRFVKAGGPF